MRGGIVFLESYYDAVQELCDSDRLMMYDAIIRYGLFGELVELPPTLNAVFKMCRPNIDSSIKRYEAAVENGRKGGLRRQQLAAERNADGSEQKLNQSSSEIQPELNQSSSETEPNPNLNKDTDKAKETDKEKNREKNKKNKKDFDSRKEEKDARREDRAYTLPTRSEFEAMREERLRQLTGFV